MKYKTQWRVPRLLNLHKHETEDRKRGDAGIKARSSDTSNAGFFILSSLKEEWVSSWSKCKFPVFERDLNANHLLRLYAGHESACYKTCKSKDNGRADRMLGVHKSCPNDSSLGGILQLTFWAYCAYRKKEKSVSWNIGVGKDQYNSSFSDQWKINSTKERQCSDLERWHLDPELNSNLTPVT